jgi:hypothetical protein
MCCLCESDNIKRRDFIKTVSVLSAGIPLANASTLFAAIPGADPLKKQIPTVYGAFIYPPSAILKKEGYYSWPGSGFDAEGRQKQYMAEIQAMEGKIGIHIQMEKNPLDIEADVTRFIKKVKQKNPDGLLLIPFKKLHWDRVERIIEEVKVPTVILATMGVLLMPTIRKIKDNPGIYMISSQDNLGAVEKGMKMIHTARRMRDSVIMNITGKETLEHTVPIIGTKVRTIPHQRFYDAFKQIPRTAEVEKLGKEYIKNAQRIIEPTGDDIYDAAKSYYVFKKLIDEEQVDAVMMNCLPGLKHPHQHVPPCMGYMSLRDEGFPMGCESDLDATLTMMLQQFLFNRPGFQHNPSVDTEKNHYFGAHCVAPSKMNGPDGSPESYILHSHAEAGWGTVPRVLMREDQEVTIAKYLSSKKGEKPQLLLYSGKIIGCPPIPPTGGCRTNVETTINELDDVAQLKGHHLCMIYGNYVKEMKTFCQLYDIEVVV